MEQWTSSEDGGMIGLVEFKVGEFKNSPRFPDRWLDQNEGGVTFQIGELWHDLDNIFTIWFAWRCHLNVWAPHLMKVCLERKKLHQGMVFHQNALGCGGSVGGGGNVDQKYIGASWLVVWELHSSSWCHNMFSYVFFRFPWPSSISWWLSRGRSSRVGN